MGSNSSTEIHDDFATPEIIQIPYSASTTFSSEQSFHRSAHRRVRNFQWCWNSKTDSSPAPNEVWKKFNDFENEIIEDAHNSKQTDVELDADYIVNLQSQELFKREDPTTRWPIKKVELPSDEKAIPLREERFSMPVPVSLTSSSEAESHSGYYQNLSYYYYEQKLSDGFKTIADVIDDAVKGILTQGEILDVPKEAMWLVEPLRRVKHYGVGIEARSPLAEIELPSQIGETCVYIYSKESFLCKLLNCILPDLDAVEEEQIITLGPFCYLLDVFLQEKSHSEAITVYRAVNLTDDERKQFIPEEDEEVVFTTFTSTSRNRKKAEMLGNTLLVITLREFDARGMDISALSDFPHEEEFLLWPGSVFEFVQHKYDRSKRQHVIHLRALIEKD